MKRPVLTLVAVCLGFVGFVGLGASAAHAEPPPPPRCFRVNDSLELPTCTWDGRTWSVSYDDAGLGGGMGPPPAFWALAVIAVLVGIGFAVWRVSLARQMARQSGMDPGQATAVTLLSDDGLDATYLAANLRGGQANQAAPTPPAGSASARLRELRQLRDDGLVTAEEYEARRKAIVDSL